MLKLLKWMTVTVLSLALLIGLAIFGARFNDGPIEILTGGPFRSGELTPAPDDWSFLADRELIEFQTMDPATSRTVWLGVHEGRLFLVSGYMRTGYGSIWKQWPHYLENDDRIILRVDGRLYEQRLERITQGPEIVPVLSEYSRKYFNGAPVDPEQVTEGHTWMYEVVDR